MLGKGMTVSEATHRWVAEFSRFPRDMISKLMSMEVDSWREVTKLTVGNQVYLFSIPTEDYDGNEYEGSDQEGEIIEVLKDGCILVELNDGTVVLVEDSEFEVHRDDFLPMWGTMWQFGDSCDDYWLSDDDGLQLMSDCGFRIYEHDEWGYFFGIDGAGYDFYEAHWIPAYRKRGLKWHDPETDKEEK